MIEQRTTIVIDTFEFKNKSDETDQAVWTKNLGVKHWTNELFQLKSYELGKIFLLFRLVLYNILNFQALNCHFQILKWSTKNQTDS